MKEEIESLIQRYSSCQQCELGRIRNQYKEPIVFGEGKIPAKGMIIGESPGPQEVKTLSPFFKEAPSGELLTKKLMQLNGLNRDDWFITNSVLCGPLDDTRARVSPNKSELLGSQKAGGIKECNERLWETITLVDPKIIVLLGSYAYQALFGSKQKMSDILGLKTNHTFPFRVYVSYHPAFYIYKKSSYERISSQAEKQKAYQNLKEISQEILTHWKNIAEIYNSIEYNAGNQYELLGNKIISSQTQKEEYSELNKLKDLPDKEKFEHILQNISFRKIISAKIKS